MQKGRAKETARPVAIAWPLPAILATNLNSLGLSRRSAFFIQHHPKTPDKSQDRAQTQEGNAFAALHVLNPAAPARASSRPLSPKADDKGADGWD
jgi:hypothetical protein